MKYYYYVLLLQLPQKMKPFITHKNEILCNYVRASVKKHERL